MHLRSSRSVSRSLGVLALVAAGACFNPESLEETAPQDTDEATTEGAASVATSGSQETAPEDNDEDDADPPEASTGTSSEGSTDPETPSSCGDGVVQGGEECDLGKLNAADAACTPMCTIAICGDGFVHAGAEDCDAEGMAANCDDDCTLPLCGDGVMNPFALEQCDGGDDPANASCESCVVVCDPGWSRCGGGPAAACATQIDSAASCSTCGHSWQIVEVTATESMSVDETHGTMGGVGVIESALYGTTRMVGWMGFDLDSASAPLMIQEARLRLHVVGFDFGPALRVVIDPSASWAGSSAESGRAISEQFDIFNQGPLVLDLDTDDWNWGAAFGSGWANIGLDPRGAPDSWAHFEGTDIHSLAPVLEFEGCMP